MKLIGMGFLLVSALPSLAQDKPFDYHSSGGVGNDALCEEEARAVAALVFRNSAAVSSAGCGRCEVFL
jgi:hypothetical protein